MLPLYHHLRIETPVSMGQLVKYLAGFALSVNAFLQHKILHALRTCFHGDFMPLCTKVKWTLQNVGSSCIGHHTHKMGMGNCFVLYTGFLWDMPQRACLCFVNMFLCCMNISKWVDFSWSIMLQRLLYPPAFARREILLICVHVSGYMQVRQVLTPRHSCTWDMYPNPVSTST